MGGVVSSFAIVRHPPSPAFAADVPYAVALIALDEGPTMVAGLRGCAPEAVSVGLRVEVEFEARSDDIHLPYFHPSGGRVPFSAPPDAVARGGRPGGTQLGKRTVRV